MSIEALEVDLPNKFKFPSEKVAAIVEVAKICNSETAAITNE